MSDIAPDGSPVDLYARMPTFGEPEVVDAAIAPGTEILELGSGTGRMTHRLLELGHRVTAVDQSAEMLAHVRGAERVHADLEDLDLGRRFGCVLLASQLVNVDDDRQRAAFLATCARHVAPDGVVLIQRYDPEWAEDPRPSESERGGVVIRLLDPRREDERLTATAEYEVDGRTFRHGPFTSRILTDDELDARLGVAGLLRDAWLDERRTWLSAMPAPDTSALYVAVPEAEPLVGPHRVRWDPAGAVVPAHVTVLFPFVEPEAIDGAALAELRGLFASRAAFDATFATAGRFPDVLWLAPEPADHFTALTDAVAERFPGHPPYGGVYDAVVPHLTVADGAPTEVLDRLERDVAPGLPIRSRVDAVHLVCREGGHWHDLERFSLGS